MGFSIFGRSALAACAALLVCSASSAAWAGHIIYDFKGVATGDLNGTPFTRTSFDITGSGNTGNVALLPAPPYDTNVLDNFPVTLKVDLTGVGTVTVTDPGYVFDAQNAPLAGVGTVRGHFPSLTSVDFLWVIGPAILHAYDMVSALSPVDGLGFLPNQNNPTDFNTDKGVLTFDSVSADAFFSAILVPEPQVWTMMILGLGGIGAAMRRRRAEASA